MSNNPYKRISKLEQQAYAAKITARVYFVMAVLVATAINTGIYLLR